MAQRDGWETFFAELDSFQLHMPGGKTVPFCDTENLLNMVAKQYPRWKQEGAVTSVPTARIPKLFLHNQQMTKEVEKKLKPTQKGDGAEKNLFRLFVEEDFGHQPGILIFPTLDGSHIFKEEVAKFELDMVLLHQKKGIFVFNVKNVGGSGSTSNEVEKDIKNHNNLIRMLLMYKNSEELINFSVHTVVCNFNDSSRKFMNLEEASKQGKDKVLVFNKDVLKPNKFSLAWLNKIQNADIVDIDWNASMELLAARLIALNSIEGALALIHNQMTRGLLQTVTDEKHLEAQMTPYKENKELKDAVVHHSMLEYSAPSKKRIKKKFILWTKDQLSIIAKVHAHLTQLSQNVGLRLLVTGCKGSGKTMLLTFIANMAQCFFDDTQGVTLVCDGSFSSPVLVTLLEAAFVSTNIRLYSAPAIGSDFESLKAFNEEAFARFREDFASQLRKAKILLCDEFRHQHQEYLLADLQPDQHCVLFASAKDYKMSSDYEVIHLGASLRSTCRIAKFADSWIHAKHLGNFEFSCNPAHNFEGENLDIKFVKEGGTNLEQDEQQFVQQCVNFICEHAEKSRGLEVLPVVPLLDCKSKEMVKQKLLEQSFTCFSPSFRAHGSNQNIPRQDSAKISSNDLPVISFFNGSIIEGAEFGTVLILVRLKEPSQVPAGLGQQFFTAITRASTRVAIIVGEIKSTEDFQKNCTESNLNEKFEEILRIVRQRRESKPSIVIVGANSSIPGFRNESRSSTPIPEVDGVSLHVDNQTCFLHMDDLYKQSDLVKLQEFGIRLVILFNENATCPWQFLFYYSSLKCIKRFINETGNSFRLFNLTDLNEDKIDEIVCLAGFCAEQSGLPGATQPDSSRQHKRYDSPAPESSIFSWDKWKAKGTEHYNRGQKIFAADNYVQSLVLLERQYYSHIAAPSDFNAAVQARQELAKLCTNVATMYIQHHENPSHEQQEIYDRFRLDFELGATFESCINTAFRHAMRAIEWNAGWRKGFAKVSEITSKIEQYYSEKKLSIQNSSDTALQEILSEKEIRKTDQCFVRFRQDVTFPLPNFSQTSLDATIETYKDQSETAKLEDLISLRKKISELCAKSASESFTLIKSRVTASNAVNFLDLLQIGCEARQLFEYPIQIAMESLYWNPFQPEAYDEISRSLDRLKDITGSLKDKANILSQDIYLKQYTECEIQDYNQYIPQRVEQLTSSLSK